MESAAPSPRRIALLLSTHATNAMPFATRLLPEGLVLQPVDDEGGEAALVEAFAQAHFLLGFVQRPWSRATYEAAASLKLIQLLSAGYDKLDLAEVARIGVPVANNGGANAVAVAEHALMLMLAVYRRLVVVDRLVRAGGWRSPSLGRLYELEGKLVGVVGLGMIGRQVAQRLRAFAARVQYYDACRLPAEQEAALGVTFAPLDDLLATSDVVTLHVPLRDDTRGMIDERALGLMKETAILINTCRGEVVAEEALYRSLARGRLAGAGLDTMAPEPPAPTNPLLRLDNVIVTPHTAGPTWDSWPKRFANGYHNIQRVARGEPPLWVVPELRQLVRA